jgi:hypothetical protein
MSIRNNSTSALIVIPHFFKGESNQLGLFGSSDLKNIETRKKYLQRCLSTVKSTFESLQIEYEICIIGINDSSLLHLDLSVEVENPKHLPWIAMDFAYERSSFFDLVMVMEDDIEVNQKTIHQLIEFNTIQESNCILIANRIETYDKKEFCVDLLAMPGWKGNTLSKNGFKYRESINTHSGMILLSSSKFRIAYEQRPFNIPTRIIGDFMASAFANMHAYFQVVRAIPTSSEVTVFHLDSWVRRMVENNILDLENAKKMIHQMDSGEN